jgi:hypothetical protein
MKFFRDFVNRLRPKSDYELMVDYLSTAQDVAQLEYMMKMWDARNDNTSWMRR